MFEKYLKLLFLRLMIWNDHSFSYKKKIKKLTGNKYGLSEGHFKVPMQSFSAHKRHNVLWARVLITVFFQLYKACTITRWRENGYSEMEELNSSRVKRGAHSTLEKGNTLLSKSRFSGFFFCFCCLIMLMLF